MPLVASEVFFFVQFKLYVSAVQDACHISVKHFCPVMKCSELIVSVWHLC